MIKKSHSRLIAFHKREPKGTCSHRGMRGHDELPYPNALSVIHKAISRPEKVPGEIDDGIH